jgi:glycosyltransferase involved in cell wall biosynthesis
VFADQLEAKVLVEDYRGHKDHHRPGEKPVLDRPMKPLSEARIAIVFEWLQHYGGVERVIAGMRELFPNADLFALICDPDELAQSPFEGATVHTSFIQRLPWATKKHRYYLPLMPLAVEQFDLRSYDLVLSSSHMVSKGVLTRADQLHISYTHTPVRYAWELYQDYLHTSGLTRGFVGRLTRLVLHYLRMWDVSAANRVDVFLANSANVARRIEKTYRRPARTIYPPVDVDRYRCDLPRNDFYVTVSRLVPYKRLDLVVQAFTRMHKPLVLIGDGPERKRLQRMAGSNIRFLGYQPDENVVDYLQQARGFVFAAHEDFGISPVEAQAAGCPVIGYGKGGVLETVIDWPNPEATGTLFDTQTVEALEAAVALFEANESKFDPRACRRNAERFHSSHFQREFHNIVGDLWNEFQETMVTYRRPIVKAMDSA